MQDWGDYPSVGIPRIDEDHRQIALALRRFIDAVEDDDGERSAALAGALIERTAAHFALEELLMKEFGYLFLSRHTARHDAFLAAAKARLEELLAQGLTSACLRWAAETMDWFGAHVLSEDIPLSRALIAAEGLAR